MKRIGGLENKELKDARMEYEGFTTTVMNLINDQVLGQFYREEKLPIRIWVTELHFPSAPPASSSFWPITLAPYLVDEYQARTRFAVKVDFSITIKASKGTSYPFSMSHRVIQGH